MLILPLNNFPWVLNGILDAKVSLDRIQCFLELSDQDLHAYYTTGMETGDGTQPGMDAVGFCVEFPCEGWEENGEV